jgi:hypothetical protein
MTSRLLGSLAFLSLAVAAGAAQPEIRFDQFYAGSSAQGAVFSPVARSLAGKRVRVVGYAAPPYRAEAGFFVLTQTSTHICPYCNSDPDWPIDVIVVYPRDTAQAPRGTAPVAVEGTLEIGPRLDAESGLSSRLRLVDAVLDPGRR